MAVLMFQILYELIVELALTAGKIKNQVWNRIPPDQMMHGQHNGAIGRGQLRSAHDAGSVGHPNKVRDMVSCP